MKILFKAILIIVALVFLNSYCAKKKEPEAPSPVAPNQQTAPKELPVLKQNQPRKTPFIEKYKNKDYSFEDVPEPAEKPPAGAVESLAD